MKPQLRTLEGQNLMDLETPTTIIGICSPQDSLNTTAVYVGKRKNIQVSRKSGIFVIFS
jgi:hypothetical protein